MPILKPWLRFIAMPDDGAGGAGTSGDGADAGGGAGADAGAAADTGDDIDYKALYEAEKGKAEASLAESRKHEGRHKASKAELDALKAAQPKPKADPTPDPKPEDTGPTPGETAALEQAATTARENLILRAAPGLGADADGLLDSTSFMQTIAALDPAADDYGDKVKAAITKQVTDNPRFAAGPARAGRSGNPVGGTTGKTTPKTLAEALGNHYSR